MYLRVRENYIKKANEEYEKTLPNNRRLAPTKKKEELGKMLKGLQTEVSHPRLRPPAQPPAETASILPSRTLSLTVCPPCCYQMNQLKKAAAQCANTDASSATTSADKKRQ